MKFNNAHLLIFSILLVFVTFFVPFIIWDALMQEPGSSVNKYVMISSAIIFFGSGRFSIALIGGILKDLDAESDSFWERKKLRETYWEQETNRLDFFKALRRKKD